MTEQRFRTHLQKNGSKTVLPLPFDPNAVWGEKQRHDVTGTVNGRAVRGPLTSDGTAFSLALGPSWLRDNPLEPGAPVDVILAPEGPQVEQMAADLADALKTHPPAKAFFESLPSFYRKNYLRWIESAKRPETRAARIAEMISLLQDGKRQK